MYRVRQETFEEMVKTLQDSRDSQASLPILEQFLSPKETAYIKSVK